MPDFAPHDLTSNTSHAPYVVAASSFDGGGGEPYRAFDGVAGGVFTYWMGVDGGADWLSLDVGSGASQVLAGYRITVNTVPQPERAPKAWTLEGSNDNSTWTVLDTQTGQTSWTSGESRTFSIAGVVAAYRWFRLNVSANNGDPIRTQVGELYLYSVAPPPAASNVDLTQEALERADAVHVDLTQTQTALEFGEWPPPPPISATQAALEFVEWPPGNEIWDSQVCLEVAFKGDFIIVPAGAKNFAYIGLFARTA